MDRSVAAPAGCQIPVSSEASIGLDTLVADVMKRWPETVGVFLKGGMACPGCPMASFMTVAEAARSYAVEPERLLATLRQAAAAHVD